MKKEKLIQLLGLYLFGLMEEGVAPSEVHERLFADETLIMRDPEMLENIVQTYKLL